MLLKNCCYRICLYSWCSFLKKYILLKCSWFMGFPSGSVGKESSCSTGDTGSVPGSGRSPGEGNGNLFQYSCLENPTDRGAWRATVQRVAKSQTQLSTKAWHSWFTMCSFLLYSRVIQLCIYIYSFSFSIMVYHRILNIVPYAIQ